MEISTDFIETVQKSLLDALDCLSNGKPVVASCANLALLPLNPMEIPEPEELFELTESNADDEAFFCGVDGHGFYNNYLYFYFISKPLRIALAMPCENADDDAESRSQLQAYLKTIFLLLDTIRKQSPAIKKYDGMTLCASCDAHECGFVLKNIQRETINEGDSWLPIVSFLDDSFTGSPKQERIYG